MATNNEEVLAGQEPIKVGVVGLGRAGWNIHVKRMRGDERFVITDVCDFQEERLKEANAEFGCNTHQDFESFLANATCELVVVASQSVAHGPQTIAALKAGYDVLVEKPMSMDAAEARDMINASKESGKRLFVHQNYRYHLDVQYLREIITNGRIGNVFEIRIRALNFVRRSDWQTLQKFGGGTLNNTCPHFIDASLLFLESPVKNQFSQLRRVASVGDADDHVKLLMEGENGRVVDLEISSGCAIKEPLWTVLGSAGTLQSDGKTVTIKRFDPARLKELEVTETPAAGRQYGNDDKIPWQTIEEEAIPVNPSGDYYDNVWDVFRNGAEQEVQPEQVYDVMRVIEKAHEANPDLRLSVD